MEIVTETKPITNTQVPEGVSVTKQEAERTKRGPGRPSKPFVSEWPVPPKFEINKPDDIFEYLRTIAEDKLKRGMLVFYRHFPVCDMTEGGSKDKYLEKIPCENHPFIDTDWERQLLHRYGSGTYACYLNEMNRTICRCMKIETRWDLENYPPIVDPQWLEQDHPQNRAYVQYLRGRGVKLPTQQEKEIEEGQMQLADTVSKLTDTLIARTTPVPQQVSMGEKLTYDAAKSAIDIVSEQAKLTSNVSTQGNNPIELVNALVGVAKEIRGNGNNGDDTLKLFLTDAMARAKDERQAATEIQRQMFELLRDQSKPNVATQPKTLLDQMKEMAEMRTLMRDAFGIGAKDDGEEKEEKENLTTMVVKNLPAIGQAVVGIFGQVNQSLAMMTRMKEMDALAKTGQLPTGAAPVAVPQAQPIQPITSQTQQTQPNQPSSSPATNGQPQPPAGPPINPATNQPYTPDELEAERQAQIAYAVYHPLIAMIAQPMLTHLSDPGHMEDGELVRKDGYDFAEWFVSGQGRLMYDQVKGVGAEKLMGAVKSYGPLWQQIGGMEERVRQFVGEFLTLDELATETGETDTEEN